MPSEDLTQAITLIKKDFSLDQDTLPESTGSLEDLQQKLIPVINHLLDRDMSRLLNALYRIDVKESVVKNVLTTEKPDKIAPVLAELIVQREIQKVITRRKYSGH